MTTLSLDTAAARHGLIEAVQVGIDAAPANSAKWKPLKKWFVESFGETLVSDGKASEGKKITAENQVWNRIHNELAGNDPKYAVVTAANASLIPAIRRHLGEATLPRSMMVLILDGVDPVELQVYREDDVGSAFKALFPDATLVEIARPEHGASLPLGGVPAPSSPAQILVDERVRRMVKIAIASSVAVVLVGPPGTGKTRLLEEVIEEIRQAPGDYGFPPVAPPLWATPEESWTTRDLVGGLTVDEKGLLRFREGYVLDAIRQDRWLVLDETNRADMDKIFGGLMTWLSSSAEIELGPVTTHFGAPSVQLAWSHEQASSVENQGTLGEATPVGDPVRFLAGASWRLLGTYNAVDAQRVFRFGSALGRRFARVPIPAPSAELFKKALEPSVADLPSSIAEGIAGLYAAHSESQVTELGPALFMAIPRYVRSGLGLPALALQDPGPAEAVDDLSDGDSAETEAADPLQPALDAPVGSGPGAHGAAAESLLAEAYLVSVGTWLTRVSDEALEQLGERVIKGHSALSKDQWDWVVRMSSVLG